MSWVLADDIIADKGIPCLSVKICLFAWPVCFHQQTASNSHVSPPKGDFIDILSSDCQIHPIPFLLSYSFNNFIQILLNISN